MMKKPTGIELNDTEHCFTKLLNGNVRMAKKSHSGCDPHCHGLRIQTALQPLIITLLKGLESHFPSRAVCSLQILNGPGFTMSKGVVLPLPRSCSAGIGLSERRLLLGDSGWWSGQWLF